MVSNAREDLGAIRDLRIAAGLSQERLAREADCSTAYVRVLERGYVPADPGEAPAYHRVLEVLSDERRPHQAGAVQVSGDQSRHDEA